MIARNHEALLDHIREEVARRRKELDCLALHSPANEAKTNGSPLLKDLPPLDLQPARELRDRVRLRDLLQYHDRRFVEQAYRYILRRNPDAGENWYLNRLRKGGSKISTLLQIRYSREGKSQRARIRGLGIYRLLYALARMPLLGNVFRVIGYAFRLLGCLAMLPRQQKQQEAWKQYVMSLFTEIEDHVNRNQRYMKTAIAGVAGGEPLADWREDLEQKLLAIETKTDPRLQAVEETFGDLEKKVENLSSETQRTGKAAESLADRLSGLESAVSEIRQLTRRLADVHPVVQEASAIAERLKKLESGQQRIAELAQQAGLSEAAREIPLLVERLASLETKQARIEWLGQQVSALRAGQVELEHWIRELGDPRPHVGGFEELMRRFDQLKAVKTEVEVLSRRLRRIEPPTVDGDEFYAELEDRFRGPTQEIRSRQEYYISYVEAAGAGRAESPILDLGCGRGEWLGVLRDRQLVSRGIDTNQVFLNRCRRENLPVQQAEALHYLESIAPGSLGAITGFHIIEHLTANEQIRLVQLAFRALRPGGLLILETPNPEHLSVAALRFYLDPTHVRQVPAPLLEFIAEQAGFEHIQIERRVPSGDGEAAQGWSRFQDYALIARRPQ